MPKRKKSNLSQRSAKARAMSSLRGRESSQERQVRLEINAENTALQRFYETSEHRQARLEANAIRMASQRSQEAPQQRLSRLQDNAERMASQRSQEAPQQRLVRREEDAARHASQRLSQAPNKRQAQLELDAQRHAAQHLTQTDEQHEANLLARRNQRHPFMRRGTEDNADSAFNITSQLAFVEVKMEPEGDSFKNDLVEGVPVKEEVIEEEECQVNSNADEDVSLSVVNLKEDIEITVDEMKQEIQVPTDICADVLQTSGVSSIDTDINVDLTPVGLHLTPVHLSPVDLTPVTPLHVKIFTKFEMEEDKIMKKRKRDSSQEDENFLDNASEIEDVLVDVIIKEGEEINIAGNSETGDEYPTEYEKMVRKKELAKDRSRRYRKKKTLEKRETVHERELATERSSNCYDEGKGARKKALAKYRSKKYREKKRLKLVSSVIGSSKIAGPSREADEKRVLGQPTIQDDKIMKKRRRDSSQEDENFLDNASEIEDVDEVMEGGDEINIAGKLEMGDEDLTEDEKMVRKKELAKDRSRRYREKKTLEKT